MDKTIFAITNLNLIVEKLKSAITRSKLANFAVLKLGFVGKRHILNMIAPFKM